MTTSITSTETDVVSIDSAATLETVSPTPVLITEQEVMFATAAAVPLQPVKTRGWISRVVGSIALAASVTSSSEDRPKPQRYPPRNDFLESSRMVREMDRL